MTIPQRPMWRRYLRFWGSDVGADVRDELGYHLEMRTAELIESGLTPEAARGEALRHFGDVEEVERELVALGERHQRVRQWIERLNVSWLDVKLGARMATRNPALSLVAVIGMAVAIAIGAGYYGALGAFLDPSLPLEEGDRIVSIGNRDMASGGSRTHTHDFLTWRGDLRSVRELGAFRGVTRNVITAEGQTEVVTVAEMTATGFEVARVDPLLGRPFTAADEAPGATPVLLIGYEEWQRRFMGDPGVIGEQVRVGETVHTVIGVMPPGFAFPVAHHYWVPLRLSSTEYGPGEGPQLSVFGRLAEGVGLDAARAELAAIGQRVAGDEPRTHEHLVPQLQPYATAFMGIDLYSPSATLGFRAIQLAFGLLLVIVALNVAILFYARAATRMGEIMVRTALGASRARIVTQLFVEALVLSMTAALIGLALAAFGLQKVEQLQSQPGGDFDMPFWVQFGIDWGTVVYGLGLGVLAAAIAGALPALKSTGRRLQSGLQQLSSRTATMRLGGTWTVLIVAQVAIAVAALPAALNVAYGSLENGMRNPAPAAHEMLRATLVLPSDTRTGPDGETDPLFLARYADRSAELIRRLEAEPEVAGVTFASRFPGTESWARMELEAAGAPSTGSAGAEGSGSSLVWPASSVVDPGLFDFFDAPILAGRGFVEGDAGPEATAVIVDRAFADEIGGGMNVLGRRIRYAPEGDEGAEANPWLEIVGVVESFADEFTPTNSFDGTTPRLYRAMDAGLMYPTTLAIRVRGSTPHAFMPRIRDAAATVDPELALAEFLSVGETWAYGQQAMRFLALAISAVMLSVLLLSAAGIYAMMSFLVARRRREIGIRAALGAEPRRVLLATFARSGAQLAAGVGAGLVIAVLLDVVAPGGMIDGGGPLLLAVVSGLMLAIGSAAVLGPARRALSVQPMEALREE